MFKIAKISLVLLYVSGGSFAEDAHKALELQEKREWIPKRWTEYNGLYSSVDWDDQGEQEVYFRVFVSEDNDLPSFSMMFIDVPVVAAKPAYSSKTGRFLIRGGKVAPEGVCKEQGVEEKLLFLIIGKAEEENENCYLKIGDMYFRKVQLRD